MICLINEGESPREGSRFEYFCFFSWSKRLQGDTSDIYVYIKKQRGLDIENDKKSESSKNDTVNESN